jgi:hypothetical protein
MVLHRQDRCSLRTQPRQAEGTGCTIAAREKARRSITAETRFNVKNPPNAEEKTTEASQQTLLTIIKSLVTTSYGGLQESNQSGTLIRVYVPYRGEQAPRTPLRSGPCLQHSMGLCFAPSEISQYNVQLNLEHI